ncbi:hypothetical protein BC830DRAFT_1110768 [Chytriomyces sp. MP71]|nr:hypothetical protein BC830DRAFT_1110768 [Chytriomyces sp. MP71]
MVPTRYAFLEAYLVMKPLMFAPVVATTKVSAVLVTAPNRSMCSVCASVRGQCDESSSIAQCVGVDAAPLLRCPRATRAPTMAHQHQAQVPQPALDFAPIMQQAPSVDPELCSSRLTRSTGATGHQQLQQPSNQASKTKNNSKRPIWRLWLRIHQLR